MAFVVRRRSRGTLASEGFSRRGPALQRYEDLWHELRGETDWAVALYECPGIDDAEAAVASVAAGGGLILAHRYAWSDDKALRELRKIVDRQ